jgi:hypothetical protein
MDIKQAAIPTAVDATAPTADTVAANPPAAADTNTVTDYLLFNW